MRMPIKLNGTRMSPRLREALHAAADPRLLMHVGIDHEAFTEAVSVLKFGRVFKTTTSGRFPNTIAALVRQTSGQRVSVLDLGASDGTTSLDVMAALDCTDYFLTDLNVQVHTVESRAWTLFYSEDGNLLLAASDFFVVYADTSDALGLGASLVKLLLRRLERNASAESARHQLVNPRVMAWEHPRPTILRHDALRPWPGPKVNVVILANLLNGTYFTADDMCVILKSASAALTPAGLIAIVDNAEIEAATILRVTGLGVECVDRVGPGAKAETIALRCLQALRQ